MSRRWYKPFAIPTSALSMAAAVIPVSLAGQGAAVTVGCTAGAPTLSAPGARLYPDTGNGGYRSVHTDLYLAYDATANRFLHGTRVVLTDVATQCLTSFSLDFERRSPNKTAGPDLTVQSVTVNGTPAGFSFAQPVYPGDPRGLADSRPEAHEASQTNPVGGPAHNPLPPACSPELTSTNPALQNAKNGTQCPANKLVIHPVRAIAAGSTFRVAVVYTGRPGVHNDGDGTTEGWFRATDGSFVTTEPVGTEDWMPLNDYPSAKPTYDVFDTVNAGKAAVSNGELVSVQHNAPDGQFPAGSTTWHWRSLAPVASYLVENSMGNYRIDARVVDGIRYYEVQDAAISPAQQQRNDAVIDRQPGITAFEAMFNGPFPFASDGVIVGTPTVSFAEEMQTMIAFPAGKANLDILYHENMHQWWGDNVTESSYALTFFKEGLATLAEFFYSARQAAAPAGGLGTAAGQRAFEASLTHVFGQIYAQKDGFWSQPPSNPTPFGLFNFPATYLRPGAAYIALRQILGHVNFNQALREIQQQYGGASITESQLEHAFADWLPNPSAACQHRLMTFFTQWFDTSYPAAGASKPRITGPGLAGPNFYGGESGCTAG